MRCKLFAPRNRFFSRCLLSFPSASAHCHAQYYVHRYALHNPLAHTRHSHVHHRFFTRDVMALDRLDDASVILFPALAPFAFGLLIPLLSAPVWLLAGLDAAASCASVLAAYYLTYEWLHLAYHSPPNSMLARLPGVAWLRRHHLVHHAQPLMQRFNFNVTFPIADWICGTLYNEQQQQEQQQPHAAKHPAQTSAPAKEEHEL